MAENINNKFFVRDIVSSIQEEKYYKKKESLFTILRKKANQARLYIFITVLFSLVIYIVFSFQDLSNSSEPKTEHLFNNCQIKALAKSSGFSGSLDNLPSKLNSLTDEQKQKLFERAMSGK